MKKQILLLIALFNIFGLQLAEAQFQTGIASSNHSGAMGVTINPANANLLSNGTDILLAYGSFSVLNNDFYLPPTPITKFLKPEIFNAFSQKENDGEPINQKFERLFNMKRSIKANGYIFADLTMYGPSFLTNVGRHSFGLLSSFKAASGTVGLVPDMAIFLQKGLLTSDLTNKSFDLKKVKSGTIAYTDIALNYSYKISETFKSSSRLGATFHYLIGTASVVFEDHGTNWTIANTADTSIYYSKTNFQFNYAANKAKTLGDMLTKRGQGFAMDLGYTFMRKNTIRPTRTTYCPNIRGLGRVREYQTYKWKMGIAVMDIGFIKFDKETYANKYFNNVDGHIKNQDQEFYNGIFALERSFYFGLQGAYPEYHHVEREYIQFLATRVNFQFDYHYKDYWYISLLASQRTPLSPTVAMQSPNIISLVPRYETFKYEVGIPISLIEYQYPVFGLNLRYGPIIIGSNQLLELVGIRSIKGVDFYFGLKFNISNIRGI